MASVIEQSEILGKAFNQVIQKHYGDKRAPVPLITPTGIKPLDALLGGGIISSGPVLLSSTPETGKSTVAYQISKQFQTTYENSVCVYLDIEGSGNAIDSDEFKISRIDAFGLDTERFRYEPLLLNVMELFDLIEHLVEIKKNVEEKTGSEFHVLIVWDSIPSTPSSKTALVSDPNQIIGLKARQLGHCLDKYNPMLKFNRITFLCVDQVRANLNIDGPYAPKEQSVGNFKNMKSASNIFSLLHNTQQWLFLSKGKSINEIDGYVDDIGKNIVGWEMNILTEKNKLTASKDMITVIFGKNKGIDKFWSEFTFLFKPTPTEKKVFKTKLPFPLMIQKSGKRVYLKVTHPTDSSITYTSEKFFRKKAKEIYQTDNEFRQWFDYAVNISCEYRIIKQVTQNISDVVDEDNIEDHQIFDSEYIE